MAPLDGNAGGVISVLTGFGSIGMTDKRDESDAEFEAREATALRKVILSHDEKLVLMAVHITELERLLDKHQWSGTAYGSYGSTSRTCPECGGRPVGSSLYHGNDNYDQGKGHRPNCALAAALETTNPGSPAPRGTK